MKHVRRSVLVWYSAREMYELVADVAAYPGFLPWCASAEVLERRDDGLTARLGLAYRGVSHAFTTRNTHVDGHSVTMGLVDGPFSLLEGGWTFRPITGAGEGREASRVELDLRYAFAGTTLETLVGPVFDRIANTFVDAFVRRAADVYGVR
ncbi:MAG: type II toxin-antitoxin system RatA family toxin [Rubrivivax sp.]